MAEDKAVFLFIRFCPVFRVSINVPSLAVVQPGSLMLALSILSFFYLGNSEKPVKRFTNYTSTEWLSTLFYQKLAVFFAFNAKGGHKTV